MKITKYQASSLENKLNILYAKKFNEIYTKIGYKCSFSKYLRDLVIEKKIRIELIESKILEKIGLYDTSDLRLEELIDDEVLKKLKEEYYLKDNNINKLRDKAIRKIDEIMDDVVLYDLLPKEAVISFKKYLEEIEMSMG